MRILSQILSRKVLQLEKQKNLKVRPRSMNQTFSVRPVFSTLVLNFVLVVKLGYGTVLLK